MSAPSVPVKVSPAPAKKQFLKKRSDKAKKPLDKRIKKKVNKPTRKQKLSSIPEEFVNKVPTILQPLKKADSREEHNKFYKDFQCQLVVNFENENEKVLLSISQMYTYVQKIVYKNNKARPETIGGKYTVYASFGLLKQLGYYESDCEYKKAFKLAVISPNAVDNDSKYGVIFHCKMERVGNKVLGRISRKNPKRINVTLLPDVTRCMHADSDVSNEKSISIGTLYIQIFIKIGTWSNPLTKHEKITVLDENNEKLELAKPDSDQNDVINYLDSDTQNLFQLAVQQLSQDDEVLNNIYRLDKNQIAWIYVDPKSNRTISSVISYEYFKQISINILAMTKILCSEEERLEIEEESTILAQKIHEKSKLALK